MTTFRSTEEMLGYVRQRAGQVRRRRRLLVGGLGATLAVAATAVALSVQRDPDELTIGPFAATTVSPSPPDTPIAPPRAPTVELLDPTSTGLPSDFVPYEIAAGPDGYVVIGSIGFFDPEPEHGQAWFSADGRSWESVGDDIFTTRTVTGLTASDSRYLLATSDPERQLYFSDDGRTWQQAPVTLGPDDDMRNLREAGGRFFRFQAGEMLSSADGMTWGRAVTTDGTPLPGYATVVHTGTEFAAVNVGLGGSRTAHLSPDGITWTAAPSSPVALAGVVAADGRVVVAVQGEPESTEACQLDATNPDGSPVTTIGPSPCLYPVSFAILDPTSGATVSTSGVAFFTSDQWSSLVRWPGGFLTIARSGTSGTVWASPDGLRWSASDVVLRLGIDRTLIAAGPDAAVVIAHDTPPQVALVTPG